MLRTIAVAALIASAPALAAADKLEVFDETGAKTTLDTSTVETCRMIFDSEGQAFEICRLQKVELRPPQSNRARPGQTAGTGQANVIYTKITE
ncbi:MAG: hypothetical protein AAGF90_11885 [Pseudomonadota bacterium]